MAACPLQNNGYRMKMLTNEVTRLEHNPGSISWLESHITNTHLISRCSEQGHTTSAEVSAQLFFLQTQVSYGVPVVAKFEYWPKGKPNLLEPHLRKLSKEPGVLKKCKIAVLIVNLLRPAHDKLPHCWTSNTHDITYFTHLTHSYKQCLPWQSFISTFKMPLDLSPQTRYQTLYFSSC